ncbi:MAG: SusF/SusE family outer membrane protein [Bacteroidales bacterium]|jgi:hypothetical protein|nr:SusF/SusE family outer membrane protein [Bacteroidales bacterium]
MKIIHHTGIAAAACLLLLACNKSEKETGALTVSGPSGKVVLLEANAPDVALTFTWNSGVERQPTDTVSYIFRMDIAGHDFTTATPPDTVADFQKSFTTDELNELILEYWGVHPGDEVEMEARVVASVRGEKFVYPEIAVVRFTVATYAYASVPLYLAGSAVASPIAIVETVNGRNYKWQGNLNTGGFKFQYAPDNPLPSLNKGADNNTLTERTEASQPDDLFPVSAAGWHVMTVDRKNLKISCRRLPYYFPKVYLIGDATEAGWNFTLELFWNEDILGYVYEGPLTSAGEGELKIHTDTGWGGCFRPMEASGSIAGTAVQYTYTQSEKGDLKWKVLAGEDGNYRITLNVDEMKIYFEKQE